MGNDVAFGKQTFIGRVNGKLTDKYAIQATLGEGAYARVFQIQNRFTHEMYACKELQKSKITDLEETNKEIDLLCTLDHPNIIKLYEVYETEDFIYLVMERCTGGELFDKILNKIESEQKFTEKEAAGFFKQIMSAVNYCHKKKITHRDLKPENLLLLNDKPDSPLKVIDFGMSSFFNNKDLLYDRVGTSYYISPEVLEGFYDEKCDIWSSGVILYVLLSGVPPFNGETDEEIFEEVKKKKYSFPDEQWKNISSEAKDLIKKMLCPPDKRLTAEQVLNHPWVKMQAPGAASGKLTLDFNAFKTYSGSNKLKKAVMTFIANRLNENDLEELKRNFQMIDINGDGMLSLDELKRAISKNKGLNLANVEEIFYSIDTDNSGAIDYTEFITASMKQSDYMKEEKLREAFDAFDLDHSGKISKEEIATILKTEKDSDYIDKLYQKYDLNGDGEIDYDEFLNMMKEMS